MTEDSAYICPGPCNRAWEAAERNTHHTGEPHNLHPNPGQPIWCPTCRDRIETDLRELPSLALSLSYVHGQLLTLKTETGVHTPADIHASPSPAYDLWDEYRSWVTTETETVANRLGHTTEPSIGYLIGHLTHILSRDPDGIDFGTRAQHWRRRLTTALGDTNGADIVRIPGQCPNTQCNRRGRLRRDNGEDLVKCGACGTTWDYDHWQLLVRAVINAA